ncbi:MAG: hypothetical protein M3N26_04525, partial [Pseudomonadota bacterium]|nr:hypothetical protein [Pseudomonadota bacterium]
LMVAVAFVLAKPRTTSNGKPNWTAFRNTLTSGRRPLAPLRAFADDSCFETDHGERASKLERVSVQTEHRAVQNPAGAAVLVTLGG